MFIQWTPETCLVVVIMCIMKIATTMPATEATTIPTTEAIIIPTTETTTMPETEPTPIPADRPCRTAQMT